MTAGRVTLVGAGPGDPELLTIKGLRALEQADVVVYDRLVSPAVLEQIPAGTRTIDVGKEASRHPVPQHRINQILAEEAQKGHNVVRLKGGDPFVFGRGGEELEHLARQGVDFREIPGVTSAIAAAAYGGIPVTHRDYASSLHIITGHAREGEPLRVDFEALVRTGGTLVFLMGVTAMPAIVAGLLAAGMDGATPAAMVENGTLPGQRRCAAALGSRAVRAGLSVLLAIAAAGILDLVQVQNHTRSGLMGILGLPGLLVIAGDDVDVRALLELHALDALAHVPERLDCEVEPAVVFLRLAVVDPFPDPEVGNLPGVFAIATKIADGGVVVIPLGDNGLCDD